MLWGFGDLLELWCLASCCCACEKRLASSVLQGNSSNLTDSKRLLDFSIAFIQTYSFSLLSYTLFSFTLSIQLLVQLQAK